MAGLRVTKSEYVAFLDVDDHIDTQMAEEAYNKFKKDSDIDALLYKFVYLTGDKKRLFNVGFNFPLDGLDVISKTIPSWEIYTNGFYKTAYALDAYFRIDFESPNSDEVAGRLIFEKCKKVDKLEASYYYVQYPFSHSKSPSKNHVKRLESAYWLRNYSRINWVGKVSHDSADAIFINELCSLCLKHKKSMPRDVGIEWYRVLFKYRKKALSFVMSAPLRYPVRFFKDYKNIRKLLYILAMPLIVKS